MVVNAEERIRENIRRILKRRDMKQGGFAKAAAKSGPWASAYLKGKFRFPLHRLDQVAEFLEVTPAELLGRDEPPAQSSPDISLGNLLAFPATPRESALQLWYGPPPDFPIVRAKFNDLVATPSMPEEEVVGRMPRDYWPDDQLADFLALLEDAWNGVPREGLYTVTGSDGQIRWRRTRFRRQGDVIASSVYDIPAVQDPNVAPFDMNAVVKPLIKRDEPKKTGSS